MAGNERQSLLAQNDVDGILVYITLFVQSCERGYMIGNQIGEELGFRERGLLHEAGDEFRVRREHGFVAGYLRGTPAHQPPLRPLSGI